MAETRVKDVRPALGNGATFGGGLVAGIIGGMLMAGFMMLYTAGTGIGFWMPLKLIAASLAGVDALVGGVGSLLLGLVLHFAMSMAFGVAFALLARRTSGYSAIISGIAFGIAIWLVMTYAILPWLDPTMRARVAMMPWAWLIGHLLFGVGVAAAPALAHSFGSGAAQRVYRAERVA